MTTPSSFLLFGIGPLEIGIFSIVVLILFGSKLPGAARNLGRSFTEFKRGVKGADEPEAVEGDKKEPIEHSNPSAEGKTTA